MNAQTLQDCILAVSRAYVFRLMFIISVRKEKFDFLLRTLNRWLKSPPNFLDNRALRLYLSFSFKHFTDSCNIR